MCRKWTACVLALVLLACLLPMGGPVTVTADTTKTLEGGLAGTTTVIPVTDRAQTDELGDSLMKGKTLKAINTSGVMGAAVVAPNSGTKRRNKENAASVSVLTDGDYYTKDELMFARDLNGNFLAAPYGGTDWARTTAYRRVASFYSDMAGLWVDLGDTYEIDKVFVASGVQLADVALADAQAMDAATLAAAEQSYVATTYVRNLQVYISDEPDTLFAADKQVFVYTNTTDLSTWNWANIYELGTAVRGRYIGFKDSNFQTGDGNQGFVDHMAEIACYGKAVPQTVLSGAAVTPVTDHAQTEALGNSLITGKQVGMYNTAGVFGNYAPYFDNKAAEPTHEAGLSSLLTDGDYYLPDELALSKDGNNFVANPDATAYAKSTAYNRSSTFWSDLKGLWVDMGDTYTVDTVFVASGVHFTPVTLEAAEAMTVDQLAAAQKNYMDSTFVRDLQVYISEDKDTLFREENRVMVYTNTDNLAAENWANIYTLETARVGRYIGFTDKNFTAANGTDYLAELACYGKRYIKPGLGGRVTVTPVTDHAQTDALGDSVITGKTVYGYSTGGVYNDTQQAAYFDDKQQEATMEATYPTVLTDNDYYLPDELALKTIGTNFAANTYDGSYAQSTAADRTSTFWMDLEGLWVDMGASYEIAKVFVASGVHFTPVKLGDAQTMTADQLVAAQKDYMARTFVRTLHIYISDDRDNLFTEENRVFSWESGEDPVADAWANIYQLENTVTGRYIGFKDANFTVANGMSYLAELACYDTSKPFDKNLQKVADAATGITATISRLGVTDREFFENLGGLQVVKSAYPAGAEKNTFHNWFTVDSEVYTLQLIDKTGRVITNEEMGNRYWTIRFPTGADHYQVMGLLTGDKLTYVRNSYQNADGDAVLVGNGYGNAATITGNNLPFVFLRYNTLEDIHTLSGTTYDPVTNLQTVSGATARAAIPPYIVAAAVTTVLLIGSLTVYFCRRRRHRL